MGDTCRARAQTESFNEAEQIYALDSRMARTPAAEHLDALSALSSVDLEINNVKRVPRGRTHHSVVGDGLPLEYAETIIQNAARYPRFCVYAADLQKSRQDEAPPLGQVAQTEGWFDL